jgi:superfamily II DNA or RNA helicase
MDTAASERFGALIHQGDHVLVVADEVHRLGSAMRRRVLDWESGSRLGLSATPYRAGDPEGTAAIFDYFGPVVQPPFTLADAIASGALTPYVYNVHVVRLTPDEQQKWDEESARIRQLYARSKDDGESGLSDHIRHLLIRRARIAKGAAAKPAAAVQVLTQSFERGQRWIVYCDSQVQLRAVRSALIAAGLPRVLEFHRGMTGDAQQTLAMFEQVEGIIVAIRCLDEGLDIPSVTHALILASSKNPREFIQRRGRVLRRAEGKLLAHLHDAVVLPADDPKLGQDDADVAMLEGELSRAIAFGEHAVNYGATVELQRIAARFGLTWQDLAGTGFEDDDDEDE